MSSLLAPQRRLWLFFGLLAILGVLQVLVSTTVVPKSLEGILSIVNSVVFVSTPIFAIFLAAGYRWTPWLAIAFLACGALVHVGCEQVHLVGNAAIGVAVLRQTGIVCWCLGLGAFLSTLIKDKNLIVPIAIFLAMLDMVLVLTPIGLTQKMLTEHSTQAKKALYEVPKPKTEAPKQGEAPKPAEALAFVGPADFLFLGMFFVALYRFQMRTRATLYWIVPVLAGYLLVVLLAGSVRVMGVSLGMLPALLPIGATIFLVNRKEFTLNKDEKLSTLVLALIMLAVLAYGMTRPRAIAPKPEQPNPTGQQRLQNSDGV